MLGRVGGLCGPFLYPQAACFADMLSRGGKVQTPETPTSWPTSASLCSLGLLSPSIRPWGPGGAQHSCAKWVRAAGLQSPPPTPLRRAGDAFRGRSRTDDQEGCGFSTLDRDHDRCAPCTDGARTFASCSHDRSGSGWWYSDCGQADLNGRWPEPMGVIEGLRWAGGGSESALRASVMRVRTTAPRKA